MTSTALGAETKKEEKIISLFWLCSRFGCFGFLYEGYDGCAGS